MKHFLYSLVSLFVSINIITYQVYPFIELYKENKRNMQQMQIEVIPAESIIVDLKIEDNKNEEQKENKEEKEEEIIFEVKEVPTSDSSFKAYMSYRAITNKSSNQYKLQEDAITNKDGIRTVNGRLCIALGSYFTTNIGTEVDLVMENGAIIECVLADCKANKDTDKNNIATKDGSVVEFLVDTKILHKGAKYHGDISHIGDDFKGNVKEIIIYEKEKGEKND